MKTSRLISILQKRLDKHGDLEVIVTWESIIREIHGNSIYKGKDDLLYIDADENYCKKELASDPQEGEEEYINDILEKANELAMFHIQDGDEIGILARFLFEETNKILDK